MEITRDRVSIKIVCLLTVYIVCELWVLCTFVSDSEIVALMCTKKSCCSFVVMTAVLATLINKSHTIRIYQEWNAMQWTRTKAKTIQCTLTPLSLARCRQEWYLLIIVWYTQSSSSSTQKNNNNTENSKNEHWDYPWAGRRCTWCNVFCMHLTNSVSSHTLQ